MQEKQKQATNNKPPRFLNGIFIAILFVVSIILSSSWFTINYQLEKNIHSRTSEYAHSIAKVAANLSAEPLLSEDQLQLQMLVDNMVKDPYVKHAAIFAENGLVVAESQNTNRQDNKQQVISQPNSEPELNQNNLNTSERTVDELLTQEPLELEQELHNKQSELALNNYLEQSNNQPYIESIIYQNKTHGWFKIIIDKQSLEQHLKGNLNFYKNVLLLSSALLLILLLVFILRLMTPINKMIKSNHKLIKLNTDKTPNNRYEWLASLELLTKKQFKAQANENNTLTLQPNWSTSQRYPSRLFCYCQFAMFDQENDKTSECLAQAQIYLQATAQAYGAQLHGDILSGGLIAFINKQSDLNEALCVTHLLKELLNGLDLPITVRAFIGTGSILALHDQNAQITGLSLSNRLTTKISKLSSSATNNDTVFINFEPLQLQDFGEFTLIKNSHQMTAHKLIKPHTSINQQINRQLQHIKQNNRN